jgi:hypothetical protein
MVEEDQESRKEVETRSASAFRLYKDEDAVTSRKEFLCTYSQNYSALEQMQVLSIPISANGILSPCAAQTGSVSKVMKVMSVRSQPLRPRDGPIRS